MTTLPKKEIYISLHGEKGFVVYDLSGSEVSVHEELTAFGLHLFRDKLLKRPTIVNRIYSVSRFKNLFQQEIKGLDSEHCEYGYLSDEVFKSFRRQLLNEAPTRAKRLRRRAHIGTVNACLSATYDWAQWLQDTGRAPAQTIGPYPCAIETFRNPKKPRQWIKPLLLPRAGSGKRSKPMNFVPSDEIKEVVLEQLSTAYDSEYVTVRNSLIQRLAERVGLRRGSIASLLAASFSRDRLDAYEHSVDVTPPVQKNDYEDSFEVPLDLAYEICFFTEQLRKALAEIKGTQVDELFLSYRNGQPLTPSSITAIFSKVMRAAGAPLGAALHAWRHRFVQDEVDREMAFRLREGLSVSDADVCAAVSRRIGQKNPDSIQPYLDSYYTRGRRRV